MSIDDMLEQQKLLRHAANLRETSSINDADLAKDLRKADELIEKKVKEKKKIEKEKHFFYLDNSQKTYGLNGLFTKYSADKTLPQHQEWVDNKTHINIKVSWDSSLMKEDKEDLTPDEKETIDADTPKEEQMPKQPNLRIIESKTSILKHSYAPRKIDRKRQKTIKVNIERTDIYKKIKQRKHLKQKILEIIEITPFLKREICGDIDNHDRVVATSNFARKSWEDQIKAINNLKYQNQNIGPKNLDKLRESDGIEQWLATAGPSTSHKDQWHSTAGTTTSNLIKRIVDKKHELNQDIIDVAEILKVTPDVIETKLNEQFNEDIRNERLLDDANVPTHSIDSLRETLKI